VAAALMVMVVITAQSVENIYDRYLY